MAFNPGGKRIQVGASLFHTNAQQNVGLPDCSLGNQLNQRREM
jgi:hypothetical protein